MEGLRARSSLSSNTPAGAFGGSSGFSPSTAPLPERVPLPGFHAATGGAVIEKIVSTKDGRIFCGEARPFLHVYELAYEDEHLLFSAKCKLVSLASVLNRLKNVFSYVVAGRGGAAGARGDAAEALVPTSSPGDGGGVMNSTPGADAAVLVPGALGGDSLPPGGGAGSRSYVETVGFTPTNADFACCAEGFLVSLENTRVTVFLIEEPYTVSAARVTQVTELFLDCEEFKQVLLNKLCQTQIVLG